jgi:hypothetical protein
MIASALVLGSVQQLSGINGICNFAPNIATAVGMSNPFMSNFVVMAWNFLSTILSIPVAARVAPHHSYFVGTLFATGALLLTGIPMYPGVVTHSVELRNGLMASGVMLFLFVFEVAMGPPFYVLAQSMFPASMRTAGCSLTVATQFLVNALVNYGFPVVAQALAGGPDGNQKKGLAIVFFIFAGCTFVLGIALKLLGIRPRDGVIDDMDAEEQRRIAYSM